VSRFSGILDQIISIFLLGRVDIGDNIALVAANAGIHADVAVKTTIMHQRYARSELNKFHNKLVDYLTINNKLLLNNFSDPYDWTEVKNGKLVPGDFGVTRPGNERTFKIPLVKNIVYFRC
jgi:hypothetical protein